MRIIDRAAFLALPAGTVYAKWGDSDGDPSGLFYGPVSMKGETCGKDFVDEPFFAGPEGTIDDITWSDAMIAAREQGIPTAPMMIGDDGSRDGLFDAKQHFAVYERVEVERLMALLQFGLDNAYS